MANSAPFVVKNGVVAKKHVTKLPTSSLPHLVATSHIEGTVQAETDGATVGDQKDDKTTTTSVPYSAVVYQQAPTTSIQKKLLKDDIRRQIGLWFSNSDRQPFILDFMKDTYKSVYQKSLQVVLIDAQQADTIVPKIIKRILPQQFAKLQTALGKQIEELRHLPDKLTDLWFPLILLHRHTYETGETVDQSLNRMVYISFTLIPFPPVDSKWRTQWDGPQMQFFITNFLLSEPPIKIVSSFT
jgi:hypothetical protein